MISYKLNASYKTLLCAGFFCISLIGCTSKKENFDDKILVKVNEDAMTAKTFAKRLAEKLREFDTLTVKDDKIVSRFKNEVAHDFIVQSVTHAWAQQNQVLVKAEELEAEVNRVRSYYPDDLAFRRALSNEQLSFKQWRKRVKDSMIEKRVMSIISKNVTIPTEKELKSYYDNNRDDFKSQTQVKLRQIVLSTENDAKQVGTELRKGKSFGKLAKKFSISPEATKAGLVGWVEKGTLEVFDKAFNLRVGRRSKVLKSPYGYHILKVEDKRKARNMTYKEARNNILRLQVGKREQAAYSAWLENQIRKSKVFRDEKLIESLTVETRGE